MSDDANENGQGGHVASPEPAAKPARKVAAKPKRGPKPKTEPAEMVRLRRHQDGFITDPMDPEEASATRKGFPGEYEIFS